MQSHDIVLGIVQDEVEKIEMQNRVQTAGELAKESSQIAMLQDGLRHIQQGLVGNRFQPASQRGARAEFRVQNTSISSEDDVPEFT